MRALLLAALLLGTALPAAAHEELRPFVRGSWSEVRQAHTGKPTVVHFWGVTCGPCIAELPHWTQLVRDRKDMNLVLIAADPVPEKPADLARALARAKLAVPESWAFADNFAQKLYYEIDPRWRGELPRTMLIAADGTVEVIRGVGDPGLIRAWLDKQKTAGK
jgi:thiol-disulfide isomerase/thioredoxin